MLGTGKDALEGKNRRRYLNNALVQAQNAKRGKLEVVAIRAAIELKMGQVAFPGKTSKGQ